MRVDTLQPVGRGEQAGCGPLPGVTDHLSGAEPRKACKNLRKKCPRNLAVAVSHLATVWTRSIRCWESTSGDCRN
jgi:hypothetical protein